MPSGIPPLAPVSRWSVSRIRRLHASLKPFVYDQLDIDTPIQRAPLRIAISGIRMSRAETGWCKDPPQRNIPLVAKVICRGGSTIFTELLVRRFRSGFGGIARDLDHVAIGGRCKSGKLVQIRFGSGI